MLILLFSSYAGNTQSWINVAGGQTDGSITRRKSESLDTVDIVRHSRTNVLVRVSCNILCVATKSKFLIGNTNWKRKIEFKVKLIANQDVILFNSYRNYTLCIDGAANSVRPGIVKT